MKMTRFTKTLSVILCLALVVAIAVFATGCSGNKNKTIGTGEKSFTFIVVDKDGTETPFSIKSDAATVGAALLENNLIAGDESEYGLYVKTVNGTTLDYDTDHMYWAFYVNDDYAQTGVDSTELVDGTTYKFVATEG